MMKPSYHVLKDNTGASTKMIVIATIARMFLWYYSVNVAFFFGVVHRFREGIFQRPLTFHALHLIQENIRHLRHSPKSIADL